MSNIIGKRIIAFWTNEAFETGNDWPSFRVIDESECGFWCVGVDAPDGSKHDGSKVFIRHADLNDYHIWKEDA